MPPQILLADAKDRFPSKFSNMFPSNLQIAQAIAEEMKVSVSYIMVPSLKGGATSTYDEAYDLRKYLHDHQIKHLILVTDAYHSRRALYAFSKVLQGLPLQLEIAAAPNDKFNESTWWRSEGGILLYTKEAVKMVIYWFSEKNLEFIKND